MLGNYKYNLTHGWNFMRLFRLGLAVLVFAEAWRSGELLFAGLGGILLGQALLNVGCCGSAGCSTSYKKRSPGEAGNTLNEVNFEEIK